MDVDPVSARRWVRERNHLVRVTVRGLPHTSRSDVNVHIEIRSRRRDKALVNSNSEELQPRRHNNVLMNGASRIVRIERLIRILCHCLSKSSRWHKAARGKVQRARITCLHVVCDARRGTSHFERCSYRNWLNHDWDSNVVHPISPCELATNVSVQGRGGASECDGEGPRLPRVQRQRGRLNVRCYACQAANGRRISSS